MGKKTGKNQQRAAAKKKRRTDRLKKRSSVAGGIDDYRGNLSSADEYVMNMSDEEFDEYFSNLSPTLPEDAIGEASERIIQPMWDYGNPEYLKAFRESIPDVTEEEMLDAMFIEHVWVRELNGLPIVMPAYEVFGLDEHATGTQLLAEAKRWHDDGQLGWHITEHIHISPTVDPLGPVDLDEIDLDELKRFVV